METELLEFKRFEPAWEIKKDPNAARSQWSKYAWDEARSRACKTFVRPADLEDSRLEGWRAFVADPSGTRIFAPANMLCDSDAIWFFHYVIEPGRVVVVKTTITGEILYRVSFQKPDESDGYLGVIMLPTFRARAGRVEFDWWNSGQSGDDRIVKRTMKIRFREPLPGARTDADKRLP